MKSILLATIVLPFSLVAELPQPPKIPPASPQPSSPTHGEISKMPDQIAALVSRLRAHCLTKPAVQSTSSRDNYIFAEFVLAKSPPVLLLSSRKSVIAQLSAASGSISVSKGGAKTEGEWREASVILDGSLAEETIISLIDQSYRKYFGDLSEDGKHRVDLIARKVSQSEVLDDLIVRSGLSKHADAIKSMAQQGVRLKTHQIQELTSVLGASKIGGQPDLPEDLKWPLHHSGKRLAFLAQINLGDLAKVVDMEDLPADGILYFFSVYGWQTQDSTDPALPAEATEEGWTRVLYSPGANKKLKRQEPSTDITDFRPVGVTFVPIISLPDRREPIMNERHWTEQDQKAYFWKLVYPFEEIRDYDVERPGSHLLLGYGLYHKSGFVDRVAKDPIRLLLQLGSAQSDGENQVDFCWGNSGGLFFFINPDDLKKRDFSKVIVEMTSS